MEHVSVPGAVSQVELAQGLARLGLGLFEYFRGDVLHCRERSVAAGTGDHNRARRIARDTNPLPMLWSNQTKSRPLTRTIRAGTHQLEEQWRTPEPLIAHAENQKRWLKRNGTWAVQAQKLIRYTSTWLRALKRQAGS